MSAGLPSPILIALGIAEDGHWSAPRPRNNGTGHAQTCRMRHIANVLQHANVQDHEKTCRNMLHVAIKRVEHVTWAKHVAKT